MLRMGCCLLLCLTFTAANQPPEFIDTMQQHIIYENTPVGDVVYTLKGVDPEGSAVYYGLRGTNHLQVDPQSGAVTVQRIIDHEVLRELKLEVTLQDRVEGGEDNVIAVPISVIVVDRNDNVPVFEKDNYEADIREDLRIGSQVIREIRVRDLDLLGENLNVTCDPAKSSPGACQLFALVTLNSTSQLYLGSVMLRQPLSLGLSVGDQITVALLASDGVHSAWSTLSVHVQDIQNRPPVVSGSSTVVVDEGATIGTLVMKMSAVDGDTADQRRVLYELLQNPGDYFSLDEESGELTTAKRLDRESPLVEDSAIDIKLKAVEVDQGRRLRGPLTETIRQVRITIRDSNDEPPMFSRQEYSASIAENVRQGTPLSNLDIAVSDPDLGQGSEFSVRLLDDSGSFSVEPTSGRGSSSLSIKLARPALDYENPNDRKFILLLVAEESSTAEKLAATSTVTVTLNDVNDNTPKFAQDAYVAQVSEKSAPGTIITTVSAEDRDSGQLGTAGIVYRLSGRGAEKFSIDQRTGTVVVALCATPGLSPCIDFETDRHFFLNVEATDSDGLGLMSSVALKVSTLDANDNKPVPDRTEYRAVIREGATGFQPPLRVTASDPDVTSQLTYTMVESGGGVFRVDPGSGEVTVNKSQGIDLSDVGTSHLQLLVEITDGVHTVSVPLEVEILDTNNNAPQFIKSAYLSVLPESIPVGTVVERTVARDGDMDDNARLRYRLQRGGYDDFRIHPESGVVTLARRLDHERRSTYSIQILAVDSGVAPLTGTTTLSVNIINSNDKNPYFTPRTQQTEVSEDAAVGSVFYQLAAVDPDVASPDRLFFTLDGSIAAVGVDGTRVERPGAAYQCFFNVSGDGRVRVAAPLSRQTAAVVTLRVRVTDTSAVPPQSSIGRLLVSIVDVNDHSPEFAAPWSRDRPVLNYSVREELAVGTVFAHLEATDRDTRVQRYSASHSPYISVHPDTGAMMLVSRVDFEDITEIRLNVTAFDSGVPQKNATALVLIEVVNVNDETPVFSQDVYDAEVVEHSEAGGEVARLSATDEDSGSFGAVGYAIISPVDGQFSVDESGVVRLATAELDRETTSTVLLTVSAFDSGPVQGRHSATAQVNITVVDVNDQSPKFTRSEYTASIVEDIPLNSPSPILQVLAVDADDAVDGIVYSLLPGLYSAWFRLDSTSGFLYPAKPVSAQVPEMSLSVLASDGVHNDTATVLIRVTAANHDKPRFITPQRDNKIYYVLENLLEPGSLILTAEAADRDSGENGRISYYFRVKDEDLGSTDAFTIDPSSGQVRSRVAFDREQQDRYTLVLVARDAGSPVRHESVRYLQVHVRDVDDHAAVFADPVYRFTHTENTPSGHTIGSVCAGDEDSAETGRTLYFAVGGDTDSLAVTKHGDVVNTVAIDREQKHQYELIVKATSNASFYAANVSAADMDATMTLVQVAILDENDSPPVFKSRQFYAGVSEDAQFKDSIISVVAEDLDAGKNAQLVYTIRSSHIYKPGATESSGSIVPSPFSVDEAGRLSCATLMGEYRHHRFLLELVAREVYPPMRQDTAHIHVWVYDASQLVYVLLGISPEQVQTQRQLITQALSNVTGYRVVIDDVRYHLTEENVLRKTWSDVYLHVADDNQLIVSTDDVLGALDSNNVYLQQHHGYMKLQQAQAGEFGSAAAARQLTDATLVTLVALLLVLIVGLVTFCVCCCCLRNLAVTAPHHLIKKCHPPMSAIGSPTRLPSSPVVAAPAPATADVEDPAGTENPLWIDHKFKSYEEQELSMQVCHNYSGVRDDSNTATDDVQSNTYATIPQRPDSHMTLYGHADTAVYATVEHRHPSTSPLPAGPTIPGVVPCSLDPLPARPVGMDPNPDPFGDTNGSAMGNVDFGNKSRLSIARDGLPELVAELR